MNLSREYQFNPEQIAEEIDVEKLFSESLENIQIVIDQGRYDDLLKKLPDNSVNLSTLTQEALLFLSKHVNKVDGELLVNKLQDNTIDLVSFSDAGIFLLRKLVRKGLANFVVKKLLDNTIHPHILTMRFLDFLPQLAKEENGIILLNKIQQEFIEGFNGHENEQDYFQNKLDALREEFVLDENQVFTIDHDFYPASEDIFRRLKIYIDRNSIVDADPQKNQCIKVGEWLCCYLAKMDQWKDTFVFFRIGDDPRSIQEIYDEPNFTNNTEVVFWNTLKRVESFEAYEKASEIIPTGIATPNYPELDSKAILQNSDSQLDAVIATIISSEYRYRNIFETAEYSFAEVYTGSNLGDDTFEALPLDIRENIAQQKELIMLALVVNGIHHGHPHDANFNVRFLLTSPVGNTRVVFDVDEAIVEALENGNKITPIVTIRDWDESYLNLLENFIHFTNY